MGLGLFGAWGSRSGSHLYRFGFLGFGFRFTVWGSGFGGVGLGFRDWAVCKGLGFKVSGFGV